MNAPTPNEMLFKAKQNLSSEILLVIEYFK
jgi:hypothetical protein